jgi:16S rRNA (guanine966-N2)-methyltransferase
MRIVGGKYRGKKIMAPAHGGTRPTSDRTRETIFNILLHNPLFGPGILLDKSVLDVFAGTGALGLEALSRGAKSVIFIENSRSILPILYANIKAFDLPATCVLERDGQRVPVNPDAPFDLIFMDPPYHQGLMLPAVTQLESKNWIARNAVIVIELAKDEIPELPPFLSLVMERVSGAAKILFCTTDT